MRKYTNYTFILRFVNSPAIGIIKYERDFIYRVLGGEFLFRFLFLDKFQDIQDHIIAVVKCFYKSILL